MLIWFFYDPSRMFQLPQVVWTLRSSVGDVFNNFLHIDARSKISSDQKRLFIAVSLYPLSFFANTPFKFGTRLFVFRLNTFSKPSYFGKNWDNLNYTLVPSPLTPHFDAEWENAELCWSDFRNLTEFTTINKNDNSITYTVWPIK